MKVNTEEIIKELKEKSQNKEAMLVNAAEDGCVETVKLLLEAGADASAKHNKNTAIIRAILGRQVNMAPGGFIDIVRLLIEAGADVNATGEGKGSMTPLMWATNRGYANIVKLLITNGADINKTDEDRESALFVAIWHHSKDNDKSKIIKLLLKAGADVDSKRHKTAGGESPLTLAADRGDLVLYQLLLKHRKPKE